ncbi:MAG: aminotransferase class III-fold pyridoxal phosphate-dependent enzyme [Candidatus Diapherotrites archaeon]
MPKKIKFICRKPGPKSVKILERDAASVSPSLTREYSFVFKKAKGCHVWDVDARKYLDFAAGVAVANVGHTNPSVINAMKAQMRFATHCGFSDFYAETPVRFAEKIVSVMPKGIDCVFFSNSGAESVEAAYKLARWHSNKKWCIAFKPSFHGRTMGALSLTNSSPVQRERFAPFLPVKHVPYPYCYRCPVGKKRESCSIECLAALEKTMRSVKGDLAGVFFEPIAGEPGYVVPPKEFVVELRKLCNEYGALLAVDEVQSGCFRTGGFLAVSQFGVKPDIVSLSKAIGGGIPIGVTVASSKTMDWVPGAHANTFGGNLLACAAGSAALDFMVKKKLGENAKKIGALMLEAFEEMQLSQPLIGDVRGKGLMIGLELVKNRQTKQIAKKERSAILCKAAEKGLLLLPAGQSVIRICPPLILGKQLAEKGLEIIEESISEATI